MAVHLTKIDYQTIGLCMGTMQQDYRIGLMSSIETGRCNNPESKKKYYWISNNKVCTDGSPLNITDRLLQCNTDNCKRCHVASIYPGSSDSILSNITWSRCSDYGSFICQYENDGAPLNSKKNCSLVRDATTPYHQTTSFSSSALYDSSVTSFPIPSEAINLSSNFANIETVQNAKTSSTIVGALVAVILVIFLLALFLFFRRTRKYQQLKVRVKSRSSSLWSNTFTTRHETIWS